VNIENNFNRSNFFKIGVYSNEVYYMIKEFQVYSIHNRKLVDCSGKSKVQL